MQGHVTNLPQVKMALYVWTENRTEYFTSNQEENDKKKIILNSK